jgi:hypothetical protein
MHLKAASPRTRPGDPAIGTWSLIGIRFIHENSDYPYGISRLDVDIWMQSNSADQYRFAIFPGALLRVVFQFPGFTNRSR